MMEGHGTPHYETYKNIIVESYYSEIKVTKLKSKNLTWRSTKITSIKKITF